MGTTRDTMTSATGVQLAYVLIIEGYSRPLTSWHDLSAVDTAWASTDFTGGALPGLEISGNIEQRFRPFSPDLEPSTLSFRVVPEEDDVFGIAVFKTIPGAWTELKADFDTDNTTLIGKSGQGFGATGTVYLGNQAITYTSNTGGIFSGITSGKWSPFSTNTLSDNIFPNHHLPNSNESVGGWKNTAPPLITSSPRSWVDRKVGLFAHRVVGGVLDTKAQSELLFAGRIDTVGEDDDGATVLDCTDYRAIIGEAVVFTDQWRAVPKEGFRFAAGMYFTASMSVGGSAVGAAEHLVCVSGTPGASEFQDGLYTATEIASEIADWLNNDSEMTSTGGTWTWTAGIKQVASGPRFFIRGERSTSTTESRELYFGASHPHILEFLGVAIGYELDPTDDSVTEVWAVGGRHKSSGTFINLRGSAAPFRTMPVISESAIVPFAAAAYVQDVLGVELTGTSGTFRDLTADLPPELKQYTDSGEFWSLFSVNDRFMFFGRVDSATNPTEITDIVYDDTFTSTDSTFATEVIKRVRFTDSPPVIKQVACVSGTFENVMSRFMASTDGKGTNHATYDDLPAGLGVGVPWSLLGQNWLDSCNELEEASDGDSITLVIEKPVKFWDLISPDLAMRGAFLRFAEGGYQLGTMQTPNASNPDWTLDKDNKSDSARTRVEHTREFAVRQIKINYDRAPLTDDYRSHYIAVGSRPDFGDVMTINARNSYAGDKGAGDSAETLCEKLTAELLSVFNRPLLRWRRSIAPPLFLAAPGDTVSFADNWTRDPTTGQRDTAARGATVLSVSYSFGIASGSQQAMNGTMELLFHDEDRFFPMSYAAESDESLGSSAWDSGSGKLYLKEHAFSLSSGANDYTYFNDTDAVRILEVDPADPASPDEFTDVINGDPGTDATGDFIILADGFGSGANPAFDSSKIYLVLPDDYDSATDTQKLQAFQADDADGYILDTIKPNLWGKDRKLGHSRADITRLPARHSTSMYGDGRPVTPAHVDQGVRMANNLVNYKLPNGCAIIGNGQLAGVSSGAQSDWAIIAAQPYYVGDLRFASGRRQKLYVGPSVEWEGGGPTSASLSVRVRLVSHFPWSDGTDSVGKFAGPIQTSSTWTIPNASAGVLQNLSPAEMTIVRANKDRGIVIILLEAKSDDPEAVYFEGFHRLGVL